MDNNEITVKKIFTWKTLLSASPVLSEILLFVYMDNGSLMHPLAADKPGVFLP